MATFSEDYYKILQVDPPAEQEAVRAAYERLALKYHPDTNRSPDATRRMQEIDEAYAVISNPGKRAVYDHQRAGYDAQERPKAEASCQAEYERQGAAWDNQQQKKQSEVARVNDNPDRSQLAFALAPGVTMEFVRVPAGEFLMGAADTDREARSKEKPQHRVYLDEYFIGKYPVTVAQFAAFVAVTKYKCQAALDVKAKANHPVTKVTWQDAAAFCEWVTKQIGQVIRLPSEAEWEKAARGTRGNDWDERKCNSSEGSKGGTMPVGTYSPQGDSPYGAADMAGNVWEWCHSLYKPYPYQATDGRESEVGDDYDRRVLRGRSWGSSQDNARCASRGSYLSDFPGVNFGFRCAANELRELMPDLRESSQTTTESIADANPLGKKIDWIQVQREVEEALRCGSGVARTTAWGLECASPDRDISKIDDDIRGMIEAIVQKTLDKLSTEGLTELTQIDDSVADFLRCVFRICSPSFSTMGFRLADLKYQELDKDASGYGYYLIYGAVYLSRETRLSPLTTGGDN